MADCRTTHITKKRQIADEHIKHAGRPDSWHWKRQEIIESINNKSNAFYVLENGYRSTFGIVNHTNVRPPFLKHMQMEFEAIIYFHYLNIPDNY